MMSAQTKAEQPKMKAEDYPTPPTELFQRIICRGGTPQAECGCGRIHYEGTGEFMHEGELSLLTLRHNQEPDRYLPCDGSPSVGSIAGVTYVVGCPCNQLRKVEEFLLMNRATILRYFVEGAETQLDEAMETIKLVSRAGGAA